jgi:hypothetical protein
MTQAVKVTSTFFQCVMRRQKGGCHLYIFSGRILATLPNIFRQKLISQFFNCRN